MILQEFVNKYNGKYIEYHSYSSGALNQCVDSVNQWLVEGLGLEAIIGTNAIDFPASAVASGMDWIPNYPDGVPEPGSLVVYEGKYGHIDIALEGSTETKLITFSQNYPTGSPSVVRTGNYLKPKVIGWLTPRKETMPEKQVTLEASKFEELVTKSTRYDEFYKSGYEKVTDVLADIEALNAELSKTKLALEEALKLKPTIEAVKEPLRYVVSFGVAAFFTWAYTKFPFLGEIQPDVQVVVASSTGLVIRMIDKYMHELGKIKEMPKLAGGLLRF